MNSVPKAIAPCSYELWLSNDRVFVFGPYRIGFSPLSELNGKTLLMIRCYPKGQNPMSKVRDQLNSKYDKIAVGDEGVVIYKTVNPI